MSSAAAPERQLRPYLNPDYWNGHSLGYGEATGEWPNPGGFGHRLRHSKQTLQDRIGRMWKAVPIETYNDGDTFNAEAYENGTLVIFREESLSGDPNDLDVKVESLIGEPLPARSFDVSPSFGLESTSFGARDEADQINFFSIAKWGIVNENGKGEKEVHATPTGLMVRSADRVATLSPTLLVQKSPIEIGKTEHYIGARAERLVRVNILEVVAHGETEKHRKGIGELAHRLALGRHP